MAFCLWRIRWGGEIIAWESQEDYRYYPPLSAFLLERDPSEASLAGARALLEGDLAAIEDGVRAHPSPSAALPPALPPLARATPGSTTISSSTRPSSTPRRRSGRCSWVSTARRTLSTMGRPCRSPA